MVFLFPFNSLLITRFRYLSFSLSHILFLIASTKSSFTGLLVDSLKMKVLFPSYIFDTRGLAKLGRLSID